MMAKLMNDSKTQVFLADLVIAKNPWTRMKGLLGTQDLSASAGMYFPGANSIHTFFMNYALDLVFLDSKMKVKALKRNVVPGQIVWPVWGASSVVEMKSGAIDRLGFNIGDGLYVCP
jgi:uncharacterized membrane protein (UPF0127 family)